MKIVKSSLSIKIIYWITNFSLAILILTFLTSIVFNILLYTDFFGNNLQLHTRFPVKIDILESEKRPVSVVADNLEIRNILSVKIFEDRKTELLMLFDPETRLEDKILDEQFID